MTAYSIPPSVKKSSLWQSAFEDSTQYADSTLNFYRQQFILARDKASVLVDRIKSEIPGLTVHDITHLDALWELASLVAGEQFQISPAEGFVLGCSFLMHDAAMCIAAYEGGLSEIRDTVQWADTVALIQKQRAEAGLSAPDDAMLISSVLPAVLRILHAEQAEKLPFIKWTDINLQPIWLIQDEGLRQFYGSFIGKIARSHGEKITRLQETMPPSLGPFALNDGGSLNTIVIACLLRCADAAHLDARRAPAFDSAIVKPDGISKLHWLFQNKLAKPTRRDHELVFSSSPFALDEADAWWLCYETIGVCSAELNAADKLREELEHPRFAARSVAGAISPNELALSIPPEGWRPIDARVTVENVPRLVRLLGGSQLYGDDNFVPLRELLQNAADAVRVRRKRQKGIIPFTGEIVVGVREDKDGYWLDVSDSGVGMSERTLISGLLNFGTSFWSSSAVSEEFPGLAASDVKVSGRFGIGFFSVFMVAKSVQITTRRFDRSKEASLVLEFRDGLSMRPILRRASVSEERLDGGTTISLLLRSNPVKEGGFLHVGKDYHGVDQVRELGSVVGMLCPALDVNVFISEADGLKPFIQADDWITMDPVALMSRISGSEIRDERKQRAPRMALIRDGDSIHGRALIDPQRFASWGVLVDNGFSVRSLRNLEGVMYGRVGNLARNEGVAIISEKAIHTWASGQSSIIATSDAADEEKMSAAGVVLACRAEPGHLPVAKLNGKYLLTEDLKKAITKLGDCIHIYSGTPEFEQKDDCKSRDFDDNFEPHDDVIFLGDIGGYNTGLNWWPDKPNYLAHFEKTLKSVWPHWDVDRYDEITIGYVLGHEINRYARSYNRLDGDVES